METEHNSNGIRDRQLAALISSGVVIACFAVYWLAQIQEVRAMLKLAYG